MRIAGFLVLSSLLAAPAFAQAPWEGQQPLPPGAVPGVPYPGYVPGAPYPPGYVPGAPYRYRNEAWRRREIENERLHHQSLVSHSRGGGPSHDPFAGDQVGGGGSTKRGAAATGAATATNATTGASTRVSRGRAMKASASGGVTTTSTTSASTGPPPCRDCKK